MYTRQQAFDTVVAHLLTQGERAERDGVCLYHASNGLKCAVGCLIADKHYDPVMEGRSINVNKEIRQALTESGYSLSDTSFLSTLQSVHDQFKPQDWKSELRKLSRHYKLKFNSPKEG